MAKEVGKPKKPAKSKAKKTIKTRQPLPGSFKLTAQVVRILKQHWKPLGGIMLVYLVLNTIFASGLSNVNASFSSVKSDLDSSGGQGIGRAVSGFANLIDSSGPAGSGAGTVLQSCLFILQSLVIIWALRHLLSGQEINIKQAYYKSMAPLVPFLLVIGVILIQLLPVSLGAVLIAALINSVIASTTVATTISVIVFAGLAVWSLYMVSSSIFAAYIATLPDVEPRQALRSAKDLVQQRRLKVITRLLFLPLAVYFGIGVVVVPLILFASFLVPAVFYVLTILAILYVHTYLYSMYRSLIE